MAEQVRPRPLTGLLVIVMIIVVGFAVAAVIVGGTTGISLGLLALAFGMLIPKFFARLSKRADSALSLLGVLLISAAAWYWMILRLFA